MRIQQMVIRRPVEPAGKLVSLKDNDPPLLFVVGPVDHPCAPGLAESLRQ